MQDSNTQPRQATARDLYYFTHPEHWATWPFLPLIRRRPNGEEDLGLLYDARGRSGLYGYSCTVLMCNLFLMPAPEAELLALPRECFDTPEEMAQAGWCVD